MDSILQEIPVIIRDGRTDVVVIISVLLAYYLYLRYQRPKLNPFSIIKENSHVIQQVNQTLTNLLSYMEKREATQEERDKAAVMREQAMMSLVQESVGGINQLLGKLR